MLNNIIGSNFILAVDSYKFDHVYQIPADAEFVWSGVVPRKPSKYSTEVVAMGQTLIRSILVHTRITTEMIDEAEFEAHEIGYTFNREGWETIVREFGGKLPLAMYGVEEGRVVSPQTVILAFINTDKRFAWLPSYIETWAQNIVWKMSTVASNMRASRAIIKKWMEITGADMTMLDYKLHNFGDRGGDSPEEAVTIAGIAHAALFNGSDCTRANRAIRKLYNTQKTYLTSVEASEHSTTTMNSDAATKDDFGGALMVVSRLEAVVKRVKERGIGIPVMSGVIDTYDSDRWTREYMGVRLKDRILASGGVLVDRPDSGDITVQPGLVGKGIEDTFGLAGLTSTGHKIIHRQRAVLQGDGIKIDTIDAVCKGWVDAGFSMDGFLMGEGGGISHGDAGGRDTFSFSQKAMAYSTSSGWKRLLKEPKTDIGKKSLSGLVCTQEDEDGNLEVVDYIMTNGRADSTAFESRPGWRKWCENGEETFSMTFDEVRALARA